MNRFMWKAKRALSAVIGIGLAVLIAFGLPYAYITYLQSNGCVIGVPCVTIIHR